ncbi:hypothetical protein [Klebsiella pneumoniae]|uniref:hypothetical protein n=1 Tax=Klebsiella pneumoniae TaxID=573 RepID=UPI0026EB2AEC|nr:hypothetical protein [Klebsiella pneumoniae]MDO7056140.1 hypothetical protein [Klebsiella pneumoniae]MDO7061589.1 hypothetical protein [Klebsiella pneumoniae]MDO7102192.1 hypothetical protein [Klebsiella pneumoniae]MDO7127616.1 hypothetical protein [Klebsiella pneumoniae]MDO7179301.1 hypothetical protein [Klebsiella pneumoniae]
MWITTNNEIICDTEPNSAGFIEIQRPCPDCLGSGIHCNHCSGTGVLPAVLEKVIPVYEWAAKNSLKFPFISPEQTLIRKWLEIRLSTSNQGKNHFHSSLVQVLDKSNFPTKLQYRCLRPTQQEHKTVASLTVRPYNAKIGACLNLDLTVRKIEVLTRKFSIESFSSLLLETTDHRHFIAYDSNPSRHSPGDILRCNIQVVKRLWINNMSILQVKIVNTSPGDL